MRFYHDSERQFTRDDVEKIVAEHGQEVIIGGDPGHGEAFELAMRAVDEFKALKHVYLVGPGMETWSSQEAAEIRRNAKSVGIETSTKDWHTSWYTWGFVKKIEEWLEFYRDYHSFEIDNLDAVYKNDPEKLLTLYLHLRNYMRFRMGREPIWSKLVMKNLSIDELRLIIDTPVVHDILAEFAIFEKGSGDPVTQIAMCKRIGIQAVTPINGLRETRNYGTTRRGVPYECHLE